MGILKTNRGTVLYAVFDVQSDGQTVERALPVFNNNETSINGDRIVSAAGQENKIADELGLPSADKLLSVRFTLSYPNGTMKTSIPFQFGTFKKISWDDRDIDQDLPAAGEHALLVEGVDGSRAVFCNPNLPTCGF